MEWFRVWFCYLLFVCLLLLFFHLFVVIPFTISALWIWINWCTVSFGSFNLPSYKWSMGHGTLISSCEAFFIFAVFLLPLFSSYLFIFVCILCVIGTRNALTFHFNVLLKCSHSSLHFLFFFCVKIFIFSRLQSFPLCHRCLKSCDINSNEIYLVDGNGCPGTIQYLLFVICCMQCCTLVICNGIATGTRFPSIVFVQIIMIWLALFLIICNCKKQRNVYHWADTSYTMWYTHIHNI